MKNEISKEILKNRNGITLIVLVITIIVLLILAGVALNAISGENGILKNAQRAKELAEKESLIDEIKLKITEKMIDDYELTENELLEVLEEFGTLSGEGDITDKTLISNGMEIQVSEIYNEEIKVEEPLRYNVTFYNYDGTILLYEDKDIIQGTTAIYNGTDTTREDDDNYIYTFVGWGTIQEDVTSKVGLDEIKRDTILYALYTKQEIVKYTVTFCDEDGTVLYTATVKAGETAVYGGTTPTKSGYTFSTWVTSAGGSEVAELENITQDMTIYASYIIIQTCFVSETKVLTENGLVNIEDIKEGMRVYSKNEKTGEIELKTVKQTFKYNVTKDMAKVYVNGEIIESTIEHPYYVDGKGWTTVSKLESGDILLRANGEKVVVEKVEIIKNNGTQVNTVYNFEVEDNHNYYVGEQSILVHNKAPSTGGHVV